MKHTSPFEESSRKRQLESPEGVQEYVKVTSVSPMLIGCTILLLLGASVEVSAQQVKVNKQHSFPKTVPAGNYSGITWLGDNRYAVADDKSQTAGFYVMSISTDAKTGDIKDARSEGFMTV